MLSFQISNIISLASKVENTPELVGFWEKQYKEIFSEGLFILDKNTENKVLDFNSKKIFDGSFIPSGGVYIGKHLIDTDIDMDSIQNTIDVAVRFLDSLISIFDVADLDKDLIVENRVIAVGVADIDEYGRIFEEKVSKDKIQATGEILAEMVYRASELLAEEKGACQAWLNYRNLIRDIPFENWINNQGDEIGNGRKIFQDFSQETISESEYEIIPRRNVELLNFPFLENLEKFIIKVDGYNEGNSIVSETNEIPSEDEDELIDPLPNSEIKEEIEEIKEVKVKKEKIMTSGFDIKLFFIGFDTNSKVLYEINNGVHKFVEIAFSGSDNPSKFLQNELKQKYNIEVGILDLVSVEFINEENVVAICYSGKIESKKYSNLKFKNYDEVVKIQQISSNMLEKYLSRNKILEEFREVMTNNPGVLKNLKKSKKVEHKPISNSNNRPEDRELVEKLTYKEFDIDTESFGMIKIKLGVQENKIKSLEFLLNDDFKNRFATFYSSFIFITSILNYMLSMDEDFNKVIDFLKDNMKLGSSIGLVSKVVYYSLQSIKEIV